MGATGSTQNRKDVEIGEEVPHSTTLYRIWTHVYSCVLNKRRKCTIFVRCFSETDSNETRSFFENGIKTILKLRHPYIVEFVNSSLTLKEATLVTERVQALDLVVDSLSPIEIHTGLTHILDALIFLHEKAGLSHNNICPSSVFVTLDGRWKISGFECAQKLENSRHWVQTDFVRSVKLPEFAPAEDQLLLITDIPPAARDAFAFGKLIAYVLPYMKDHLLEETIAALEDAVKSLTNDDPSSRGDLASLHAAFPAAFTNKLSQMMDFLRHFHLKSIDQRTAFFESAANDLKEMPREVVGKRLVPLLLSRYLLLDMTAHSKLLPYVMQPDDEDCENGLFNQNAFKRWVVPQILRIFRVHEASVRIALLSHFSRFVGAIDEFDLEDIVLKELVLGMKDTNDLVVSASLKAMADLVPILGGPTVTGLIHKKTFADGKPKSGCGALSGMNASWTSRESVNRGEQTPAVSTSLTHLLEEEHSEFPEVTLKLARDSSLLSPSVGKPGIKNASDLSAKDWKDSWIPLDDAGDSERDHASTNSIMTSGKVDFKVEVTKELPKTSSVKQDPSAIGKFLCVYVVPWEGFGYGIPDIGKIAMKEVDEYAEPDYFADMEPVVSSAPSLIIKLLDSDSESSKKEKRTSQNVATSRFALNANEDEVENLESWDAEPVADWDAD